MPGHSERYGRDVCLACLHVEGGGPACCIQSVVRILRLRLFRTNAKVRGRSGIDLEFRFE